MFDLLGVKLLDEVSKKFSVFVFALGMASSHKHFSSVILRKDDNHNHVAMCITSQNTQYANFSCLHQKRTKPNYGWEFCHNSGCRPDMLVSVCNSYGEGEVYTRFSG